MVPEVGEPQPRASACEHEFQGRECTTKSCGRSFRDDPIRPFHQRDKNRWAAKFGVPLIQIYFGYPTGAGAGSQENTGRCFATILSIANLAETFCGAMAGVLESLFSPLYLQNYRLVQGIRRP
jgi:hypothetical protein